MLLGRAEELEAVARLLASARLGQGGALVVVGEAGVGKTALLTEALAGLGSSTRVLWVTGTEIEQDLPFAALHAVLRPGLHLLDELPGPQADALGGALSLRPEGPRDRFATGAATLSLLSLLADEAPVVVVVDDAQWADQASVDALAFAARRLHEDRVVIAFGVRAGEVPETLQSLAVLDVGGLDAASTAELLRREHPGAGDPDTVDLLYRATGGNPLALLELGAEPSQVAAEGRVGGGESLLQRVPDRLRTAFARRLDLLSEGERAACLVAVVTGGDLRLARAVAQRLDADGDDLSRAVATGILTRTGGRLTFRHPLLRSVVYRTAPEELRRRVHLAVAEELTEEGSRDLRVWHRAAAATQLDEGLAAELESVGVGAASRSALTVASTAFERAARWSPEAGDARRRLVAAAQAAWDGGQTGRALGLLDEAGQQLPETTRGGQSPSEDAAAGRQRSGGAPPAPQDVRDQAQARAARLRAVIAVRSGSIRDGLGQVEAAADLVGSGDERVRLHALGVHACLYLADARALRRIADRLSHNLDRVSSPAAQAIGLAASGVAAVLLGEDGTAQLRAAVPLLVDVDPLSDREAVPWLMLTPLFLRDVGGGAELRRLVDAARDRVGVGVLPNLLFHVARDQATSNAWDRAAANFDEAARLAGETGQGTELVMALAGMACLDARAGRADECRAHASEVWALAHTRDMHFAEIWCQQALGDLALSEGEPREAAERLVRLVARLSELGVGDPDLDPGPELVDALLRLGETGEATQAAWRFSSLAGPSARPWTRARVERALGLITPDEECEQHFAAALAHHAQTRDDFETARTQLSYGMRLRRVGRRVDARAVLHEALTTFETLGSRLWADNTRTELTATGARVPLREPAGTGALTPQELQVCLLLAEGRTTREAAAALFLSPKTVEYHLRKAYTKLDIHSREELSASMQAVM